MKYEVVQLEERKVVGCKARTNNENPGMGKVIGGLWYRLYQGGLVNHIHGRVNQKAMGVYYNYSSDNRGDYDVMTGCEVKQAEKLPSGAELITIPAGKYAKFIVVGDMVTAVQQFWQELWQMKLDRAFTYDFEEYQNADPKYAEIHMYIALN